MADGRLQDARVLVVDDDAAARALVREALELEGALVSDCERVEEAAALVAPGALDVVVSDVQMPAGGGAELYRQACARDPRLMSRFVFMSGDPTGTAARHLRIVTGCRILAKPVALEVLIDAVARLVGA